MKNALLLLSAVIVTGCGIVNPSVPVVEPTTLRPTPAPLPAATRGGIWTTASRPIFEDVRARMPGDTITIAISEKLTASQKSTSAIEKTGAAALSVPLVQGIPGKFMQGAGLQADSSNKYDGKGETASDNLFTGTITATVLEVLPNGNMVISGEKQIGLNRQVEVLRISGIVDPKWILAGNTISSARIADARLEYRGQGAISEAQRMGWLSRFFLTFLPY
ncbi:flagellar biosynthesis protein FlgH [Betaproteobacteria bacterium GR16-43]|nr:flagellar biosynthesis protein FlgH [Betaproteobacteria bacterium GR16-43]